MQLQIALALSKEESEKEEELRKSYDVGLQVCYFWVYFEFCNTDLLPLLYGGFKACHFNDILIHIVLDGN